MVTVLVTGAGGLLGSAFLRVAPALRYRVVGVMTRHSDLCGQTEIVTADLSERENVQRVMDQVRPAVVVHCAALTNVDFCESHPEDADRLNARMAGAIAEAAQEQGARLIHVSTDAVFDGRRGGYGEADTTNPLSVYAQSKWKGEGLVGTACPTALVLRTSIFGWNVADRVSLAEWFFNSLQGGQRIKGFTDIIFSPLLTDHFCVAALALLEKRASGVFHLGSRDACNKYEFGLSLARAFGLQESLIEPCESDSIPGRAPRAKNTTLNCAKAQSILGRPLPSVAEGLMEFKAQKGMGDRVRTEA
ncbi:MAG: SDR family oxidoreductase [Terriglobales bacterium]